MEMGTQTILIGRAVECQIQTQDALVSRKHARVVYDGLYWIEDLGSSNGTFLKVHGERPLVNESFVLMGQQLFRVNLSA